MPQTPCLSEEEVNDLIFGNRAPAAIARAAFALGIRRAVAEFGHVAACSCGVADAGQPQNTVDARCLPCGEKP